MKTALITIAKFLLDNLNKLHNGVGPDKIIAAIKLAAAPAIFMTIFEGLSKWYIVNQWFMIFVFYAIAIDHILGSIVHAFVKKDFTFKKNGIGFVIKVGFCITGYSLFIMIPEILKGVPFLPEYLTMLIQFIVFIWPAGSAMGNMSILTGGKFPPIGWMRKLDRFQENIDLSEFKNKGVNESNTDNT